MYKYIKSRICTRTNKLEDTQNARALIHTPLYKNMPKQGKHQFFTTTLPVNASAHTFKCQQEKEKKVRKLSALTHNSFNTSQTAIFVTRSSDILFSSFYQAHRFRDQVTQQPDPFPQLIPPLRSPSLYFVHWPSSPSLFSLPCPAMHGARGGRK